MDQISHLTVTVTLSFAMTNILILWWKSFISFSENRQKQTLWAKCSDFEY